MSTENKADSVEPNSNPESAVATEEKNEFVARKAFEEVSRDMHKYKKTMKDAQAKVNEYEARLKAIEEEKMQENEQWKELYEKQKEEAEHVRRLREQDKQQLANAVKKSALKAELGNVKNEYLTFANLDEIEINEDGSINMDTVQKVANDFRTQHSALIPASSGTDITGNAPPSDAHLTNKAKSVNEMSLDEKKAALHQIRLKKLNG